MAQENNELKKLQKELEDAKAKCEEYLNGWKRERADFLNYKKDEMERIGQLGKICKRGINFKNNSNFRQYLFSRVTRSRGIKNTPMDKRI